VELRPFLLVPKYLVHADATSARFPTKSVFFRCRPPSRWAWWLHELGVAHQQTLRS